jgi:hypothetical protein
MRIGDQDWLEMRVTERLGIHAPSPGDVRLELTASVNSFTGRGWCWIAADQLTDFALAARLLYERMEGVARLRSLTPDQFDLSLSRVNARGYVGVRFAITQFQPALVRMTGEFEIQLPALAELVLWDNQQSLAAS